MCCKHDNRVEYFKKYIRALHCPTRWRIIEFIGTGEKTTTEIQDHLLDEDEKVSGSNLYYHLSELKKCGILAVSDYVEKGGGAPEKIWKLDKTEITIPLLEKSKTGAGKND